MGGMRLLALALVLGGAIPDESLPGTQEQRPLRHFLYQERGECHFQNGTQRVRLLVRSFWDQQEIFRFDSDLGRYVALAELGRPVVELWNGNQDILRNNRDDMERFCRGSYTEYMPSIASTRVRPIVTVTPTDHDTAPHNILLVCNVGAFFPPSIEIKWFRNGAVLNGSQVWSTDLIRNGDWSFQTEVMLETRPERGDVYACWVDHVSFEEPVSVQWEPQSDAARSKIWTGAVGFVLGLVFGAAGLTLYLCRKKGLMK